MTYQEYCKAFLPLKDKIFRFAMTIVEDRAEAEDVLQDTFEKLWLKRKEMSKVDNTAAYAFGVARNLCLDRLRSRRLHEEKMEVVMEGVPEQTEGHKEDLSNMYSIAAKVIATLPEKERTVMHLRDVEGCEMDEIAAIMQLEIPTLRVVLSRARKEVRQRMIKIMDYGIKQ